jgi:subtilisin family serine protease
VTQGIDELPAWSLPVGEAERMTLPSGWPDRVTREWAFGGSTGKGARVCLVDSGIELDHPRVGQVDGAVVVNTDGDETHVEEDADGDTCGHGTACAGIVRSLAPECSLFSVRVLGPGYAGSGAGLIAGLRWAVENDFDVVNLSISTTRREFAEKLHELADSAYFGRTILVASAHNMPVESYPWRFSSVISVGSHDHVDPLTWYYNPDPPVEFFARGVGVDVASRGGGTIRCTGNSFATPHMSGICALVLAKHPELTPFQLKSVLHLTASNVGGEDG